MSSSISQTVECQPVAAKQSLEAVDDNTSAEQAPQPLAIATGGYPFPGIPRISDPYKKRQWQLEHMAGAFRVFARKGFTEGTSGHISVRDTIDPNTFWINP